MSRPHPFHCAEPKASGPAASAQKFFSGTTSTGPACADAASSNAVSAPKRALILASTRSALFYGLIISLHRAGVKLPGAADLHVGIRHHLLPMRDPASGARDREH